MADAPHHTIVQTPKVRAEAAAFRSRPRPAHLSNCPPDQCQMGGGMWPLRNLTSQGGWTSMGVVAVTAPLTGQREVTEYERLRDKCTMFVGLSSYQEYPSVLENPVNSAKDRQSFLLARPEVVDRCIGWMDCGRDYQTAIPASLGPILLSESDLCREDIHTSARQVTKKWDFIYYVPTNPFSDFCRNFANAKRWIRVICGPPGNLTMLVVGRKPEEMFDLLDLTQGAPGAGPTAPITTVPLLPHHEFIQHMRQCRFLFLPNIKDASPRVFTEAQVQDLPALVNRNIHGGWKYIHPQVCESFGSDADLVPALGRLLANDARQQYEPRQRFTEAFGRGQSHSRLFRYVQQRRLLFRRLRSSFFNVQRVFVVAHTADDEKRRWRELAQHFMDGAIVEMTSAAAVQTTIERWLVTGEPCETMRGLILVLEPTLDLTVPAAQMRQAFTRLLQQHQIALARSPNLIRWNVTHYCRNAAEIRLA